jgi:hypothetical protein
MSEAKVYTVKLDNPKLRGFSFTDNASRYTNEPTFIKADVVLKSDHDLAMRRKDKEIELLRSQRDELHTQYNDYVYLDDLTLYDAEITKAVGEILK